MYNFCLSFAIFICVCYSCNVDSTSNMLNDVPILGDIISPMDSGFNEAKRQYAMTSYPDQFSPSMIIYVKNENDIQNVILFANECGYTIVVRSGGHQFAGLSSCNSNKYKCIQMDVSHLNDINVNTDDHTVSAGAGAKLGDLYKILDNNGLFVPGGTYSTIGLGGHFQTGGLGYLGRQFGLFMDHVYGFDIILSNGSMVEVRNDSINGNIIDLYWGVRGGSPGSYGVITKLYINVIRNKDYPSNTGVLFIWDYDKKLATDIGKQYISIINSDYYRDYIDTMLLYGIIPSPTGTQQIIITFIFCESVNGRSWNDTGYKLLAEPFLKISDPTINFIVPDQNVSSLISGPLFLISPAKHELPYLIQYRGTTICYDNDFIETFVDRADVIISDNSNNILVDCLIEGYHNGILSYKDTNSALDWRDLENGAVFRLFYTNDNEKEISVHWFEDTWNIILDLPVYNGQDRRVFGYTFHTLNENGFNIHQQRHYYFNKSYNYDRLCDIKQNVDPNDIFKGALTINADCESTTTCDDN